MVQRAAFASLQSICQVVGSIFVNRKPRRRRQSMRLSLIVADESMARCGSFKRTRYWLSKQFLCNSLSFGLMLAAQLSGQLSPTWKICSCSVGLFFRIVAAVSVLSQQAIKLKRFAPLKHVIHGSSKFDCQIRVGPRGVVFLLDPLSERLDLGAAAFE